MKKMSIPISAINRAVIFSIDRKSNRPLFEQICSRIRDLVMSGELVKDAKLPATRIFATELGVSRSTVVTAYEQLVAEGYVNSKRGSGYTVCAIGEVELSNKPRLYQRASDEEKEKTLMPFGASQPDMRLFPYRQWAKTVARVCRTNPQAMLVGGSLFGNFDLRQAIAAHISQWRGITTSANLIIITAGSTDALEVCLHALTTKCDTVGLENPGWLQMRQFVEAQGLAQCYLELDEFGPCLPTGQLAPRLVVLTPSHQFPLGGAMAPNRRIEFIDWAKTNNAWIVEDDYDSEFRYAGHPIPAMAGFDQLGRTIYVGSFSKIFSNTLRLGYIVIPEGLVEQFRTTMQSFGQRASYMPQQALAEFMTSGEFYRHIRRVRRIYGERRKFLMEWLANEYSDFGSFQDHQAGMQIVFHLKDCYSDVEISAKAIKSKLAVQPLSQFSVGHSKQNGLILGFCGYTELELGIALEILKDCILGV